MGKAGGIRGIITHHSGVDGDQADSAAPLDTIFLHCLVSRLEHCSQHLNVNGPCQLFANVANTVSVAERKHIH